MRILSGIHFTKHFIEFVHVETKRFVNSHIKVILTQQPCGQHSSMSAGSRPQTLGFEVSHANLPYVPNIKMWRRVRSRSVPNFGTSKQNATEHWQIPANSAAKHVLNRKSPPRSGIVFASTELMYRPRPDSPLHFDIRDIGLCYVMVIQQMSTNCVQTNDDGPYIITHISFYLSLRQRTHPDCLFFSFCCHSFFTPIPSAKNRNLSRKFTQNVKSNSRGFDPHPLLTELRSSPAGC